MPKKIAPTMNYEEPTGGLKLEIGRKVFGVFESYDDYGKPFSRHGLADILGPILADAFNNLSEAERLEIRNKLDALNPAKKD